MPRSRLVPAVLAIGMLAVTFCPQDQALLAEPLAPPEPVVDFARDVQPIFAKHCLSCHGAEKARGGLRLDRHADAVAGGDSGAIFIAGKPADSLLLHRVSAADDTRMPPKNERLSAAEIATLKLWIEQGTPWPDDGSKDANAAEWWSLKALKRPEVPAKFLSATHTNPIDAFIRQRLGERKLEPSHEADRRTIIRRLFFDLIGLPPTPEQATAFVNDTRADAYERLVDELLKSPQYGERWARHWLDVVHFGETHGYDKDKPRLNAWPYRDYVIRSFNEDKPYARFVQEQLAGDVLFPGTIDGIEALGFLAAGPWDFIGHAELPESKIDGKVARHLDRDDFVANTLSTFMGLTAHCAQCHNHKFDPISQEDYYRLQAVFAAIDRTNKPYDADPKNLAHRTELQAKVKAARTRADAIRTAARKKAGAELAAMERQLADAIAADANMARKPPEFGYHSAIADKPNAVKWVQVDLGESVKLDRVTLRPCHDDFNKIGAGFGFPVRFKIELSDDATFRTGVSVIADETAKDFANPGLFAYTALAKGNAGRYIRVTATQLAVRNNDFILALAELEAWTAERANVAFEKSVAAHDSIEAPVRWRRSNLTDALFPPTPKISQQEMSKLSARRDTLLQAAMGETGAAELAATEAEANAANAELARIPPQRLAYVGAVHTGTGNFVGTGANGGTARAIHILPRGDVTRPGKQVQPGGISRIPGVNGNFALPQNHTEGERRAALARWITAPENPLTWRVMANRVWQYHFGRALVDSPNDFGKMGQLPTHPELLDYLATELRQHQSLKSLHKLIVTSATYKQASITNDANAQIDADNHYLWRQNRRKLEAEAVRDSLLFVAGKLDLTMSGPSFQDFVIEKPEHSPHYQYHLHDPEDPKAHRRAVYRFVVRSKQQPFMAALDCADPSLAVEKRNQTLTPQQALALLNNKLAVAMAKHFAERVEKLGTTDEARMVAAVRLALARDPTATERNALTNYAKDYGLANACRVVLNLNEFIFVD